MRLKEFRSKLFRFRFPEEFRSFQNSYRDLNERARQRKWKKKFCFALRLCIYRIHVASRKRLTLTLLQRLNEAHPEHGFIPSVVRHWTNPPWRTWRLRSAGAEAV